MRHTYITSNWKGGYFGMLKLHAASAYQNSLFTEKW
jgi:hypothetical protein